VWRFLKKISIDILYDPAISLLGLYSKKYKSKHKRCLHTHVFPELFTIVKLWNQPRCPKTIDWTKKMWYIYIFIGVLFSHKDE
jgi:hypothetical protein